jgi:ribosomal protein S11
LAVRDYHQFVPPFDMPVERVDAFYLTAPTGLVPSTDFLTVRFSDTDIQNEIQALHNDAEPLDEIQSVYNTATSGTFTLSDGTDTTSAIAFDADADTIELRLETDIASIVDVTVTGSGTQNDPWVITFVDPGGTNVIQLTANDAGLTGGTSTVTTIREGQTGGTFTLSDGTDTTSAIAFDAAAATIETRLQTDITSIVDVTVTGSGTFADPWVIEFVDPGAIDLNLLLVDDTNLDGNSFISETEQGHGITQVDLIIDQNQSAHFWQSATTEQGAQEAEEAPAVGGTLESDSLATNDAAAELASISDENYWNVGVLEPGEYVAYFWVADVVKTASFDIEVIDDHLGTPTVVASRSLTPARSVYEPAYELRFTSTGTEDIFLVVTKTDAGAGPVRVDKYEFEFQHPILHGGSTVTVEVLVTGAPTTNGDDLQVALWY